MYLSELIENFGSNFLKEYNFKERIVKGLGLNSKDIKLGYLFFAISGNTTDGHNFICDAIKNGAKTIIL